MDENTPNQIWSRRRRATLTMLNELKEDVQVGKIKTRGLNMIENGETFGNHSRRFTL